MDQEAQRETHRARAYQEELAERIAEALPEDGAAEPLKGLLLFRSSTPTEPLHEVSKPSFCVIAQGSKEVLLGDSRYRYDPSHYLLATVELPVVGQVLEASRSSAGSTRGCSDSLPNGTWSGCARWRGESERSLNR